MRLFSRTVLNVICALLAFALMCAGIRKVFPLHVAGVFYKLQSFAQQKNSFDVVFVGTSRVFHGISPRIFDQAAGALGFRCRSYNAGIDGLNPEEAFALIRRLLACHPPRLRYLFFETAAPTGAGTPIGNDAVTERNVYWRDWTSLVSSFRIFAMEMTGPSTSAKDTPYSLHRLSLFGPLLSANVCLWARNETSLGEGFELVRQTINARERRRGSGPAPRPNWDGFFPMSQPMTGRTLVIYREAFAKARDHPPVARPDLIMRSELVRLAQQLEKNKIRVVFVVPPSLLGSRGRGIDAPPSEPLFVYEDALVIRSFTRRSTASMAGI